MLIPIESDLAIQLRHVLSSEKGYMGSKSFLQMIIWGTRSKVSSHDPIYHRVLQCAHALYYRNCAVVGVVNPANVFLRPKGDFRQEGIHPLIKSKQAVPAGCSQLSGANYVNRRLQYCHPQREALAESEWEYRILLYLYCSNGRRSKELLQLSLCPYFVIRLANLHY